MILKQFKKEHYDTLVNWYNQWNLPVTPYSWIPETSYIVFNDEVPICSAFLFQLGSTPVYWIEGITSNPGIDKEIRKQSLDFLVKNIVELQQELKFEMLLTSTPRVGLTENFKKNGFGMAPEKYTHLARLF